MKFGREKGMVVDLGERSFRQLDIDTDFENAEDPFAMAEKIFAAVERIKERSRRLEAGLKERQAFAQERLRQAQAAHEAGRLAAEQALE